MAATQQAVIAARIQALLLLEAEIPHAYTYRPIHKQGVQISDTLKTSGAINYWTISAESMRTEERTNEWHLLSHTIVLRGYREVGDESVTEPAFRALTLRLSDRFREAYTIPGLSYARLVDGLQLVQEAVPMILAETFTVHYSEGSLRALERVNLF